MKRQGTFRSQAESAKRRIVKGMRDQLYRRAEPLRIAPRLPAGEMKYFDGERTATALTVVAATWPAGALLDPSSTIDLGDPAVATPATLFAPIVSGNLNGRIGRKVKVMKIKIRGTFNCAAQSAAAVSDNATRIRLLLVQDTQTNIAQMTAAALLNAATNVTSTFNSYQNPNNFGRFRVLKEKFFTFNNASMTGAAVAIEQSGLVIGFKMNITFKDPVTVNFNATVGGTVTSVIDNSFHIVCATSDVALVPTIAYYSRVCYKE